MSLLGESSKYPSFTLRKHSLSITSLNFIYLPVTISQRAITNGDISKEPLELTLKPYLASADESGRLIIWDLTIHRSITDIQAHDKQIITVKQLGISEELKVTDTGLFGLFLTHGRDNIVKFWRLFDEQGILINEPKLIYELPVNALNFSNVDVLDELLVTPNTMNSNAFDIYDIGFIRHEDQLDDRRLKRLIESADAYQTIVNSGVELEEFLVKNESDRDDKFGIIMKLLWVHKNLLFVGYESGHVVSLRINYELKSFEIAEVSKIHFPNPVLSLYLDSVNNTVISTSIKSEIVIHEIELNKSIAYPLDKFGKISSISKIDDTFILSSWNGYIKFFNYDKDSSKFSFSSSFKKPQGLISSDLNIIGNLNDDNPKKNSIVKPNCSMTANRQADLSNIKRYLDRRDLKVLQNTFLSIGYTDGTIMTYINPTS